MRRDVGGRGEGFDPRTGGEGIAAGLYRFLLLAAGGGGIFALEEGLIRTAGRARDGEGFAAFERAGGGAG